MDKTLFIIMNICCLAIATLTLNAQETNISTIDNDLQLCHNNQTKVFSTAQHPKSMGIDLHFSYPITWNAKEGIRPHIVQLFSSNAGNFKAMGCTILINDLPIGLKLLSNELLAEALLSSETALDSLPDSSILFTAIPTKYDGEPGILIFYLMTASRAGMNMYVYMITHRLIYRKKIIELTCSYSGLISTFDEQAIQKELQYFFLLAQSIGNSIVIDSKWNR